MPCGGGRCINRRALSTGLALAVCAPALLLAYLLLFPHATVLETTESGATIYFATNRAVLLTPNDCLTLRWQADNIQAIYVNSQPQIGSGEIRSCGEQTPQLRVLFQDNTEQTYILPINILAQNPAVYLWLALVIIAVALHWREIAHSPRRLFLTTVAITLVLLLVLPNLLSLSDTIANASRADGSAAIAQQVSNLALMVFILLLVVATFNHASAAATDQPNLNRLVLTWGVGLFGAILLIASVILTVNPRGMYFATTYEPYELLLRGAKTTGYQNLPKKPDVAIMGSSRAFTLPPAYITELTGLTAYNMATEGGRIEDFLIQARQIELPKVLLIEVQEGMPREPDDIAARAPLGWLRYMATDTALLAVQKRLTGLFDLNQLAEAIYNVNYTGWYNRAPKEWPTFQPDGLALRPQPTSSQLEQAVLLDIGRLPHALCETISEQSQADVNELIGMAENQGTSLVFYLSPRHPQYYDAVMHEDAGYQTCYTATINYFNSLSEQHANIELLDFTQLSSIDGIATENGFYDSQHMTETNSRHLIDHAAETLLQAYHTQDVG